ncbi:hypothetical protein AVEN_192281-1 [Araneus ventricosus]|uniref:Uncharacterized protein n=1 Tax=Araneus ventricosus TaxID=182803 RepID=A0A4Y2TT78_ARAVE|nr:hypothetical protein AVEN_192281-1 [Araneus ventricosus]
MENIKVGNFETSPVKALLQHGMQVYRHRTEITLTCSWDDRRTDKCVSVQSGYGEFTWEIWNSIGKKSKTLCTRRRRGLSTSGHSRTTEEYEAWFRGKGVQTSPMQKKRER